MLGLQIFSASLIFYVLFACAVLGIVIVVYVNNSGSSNKNSVGDNLVLCERQKNIDGYTGTIDKKKYLGLTAVCTTDLRPAGTVMVDDTPLDVVSEGNFIKKGSVVKIINVDGSRILVRQI
mgnify:CR=1 FL=1